MINIEQKFIQYNKSYRGFFFKPRYIVIHSTGNESVGANAEMHYEHFNGGNRNASADFFVDKDRVIQAIDYKQNYSWAVGDGNGKNGITNRNSISIEMCMNADGDLNLTIVNTIELVVKLMDELKIPIERVVRHYDASGKICPSVFSSNNWAKWKSFLKSIETYKDDILFEEVLKKYSTGFNYWIDNTRKGTMCNGEWAKVLMLRIYKGEKSG